MLSSFTILPFEFLMLCMPAAPEEVAVGVGGQWSDLGERRRAGLCGGGGAVEGCAP